MTEIDLREPFDRLWHDADPFAAAFALEGEEFRHVKNRRTFRIEADGRGFFVKLHRNVGWGEILKNLIQGKKPVTGAADEYRALLKLSELGIPSLEVKAFGRRGCAAWGESFLITSEVTDAISLEDLAATGIAPELKRRLIRAVADTAGAMHRAGINHRDCYLCHFLLKKSTVNDARPELHIIDLHRAQLRKKVPYRYLVKDVAGLYFSALDVPLTRRDVWRFIARYSGRPVKTELAERKNFWRDVYRAALRLYRREFDRLPADDPLADILRKGKKHE